MKITQPTFTYYATSDLYLSDKEHRQLEDLVFYAIADGQIGGKHLTKGKLRSLRSIEDKLEQRHWQKRRWVTLSKTQILIIADLLDRAAQIIYEGGTTETSIEYREALKLRKRLAYDAGIELPMSILSKWEGK